LCQLAGKGDGVAFDSDVEVDRWPVKEQVAEGASDQVRGNALLIREVSERLEGSVEF
jgi:hypothetical protein